MAAAPVAAPTDFLEHKLEVKGNWVRAPLPFPVFRSCAVHIQENFQKVSECDSARACAQVLNVNAFELYVERDHGKFIEHAQINTYTDIYTRTHMHS